MPSITDTEIGYAITNLEVLPQKEILAKHMNKLYVGNFVFIKDTIEGKYYVVDGYLHHYTHTVGYVLNKIEKRRVK